MASGAGTVKQVLSGDTIVLIGVPRGGPPPERQITLASITAPKVAMKSQSWETTDEPFAWDAREFLRKKIIGAVVEFSIAFEDRDKQHGTVRLNGEDLGLCMIEEGLAKVRNLRPPLCARNIDELRSAEAIARKEKRGVWTDEPSKGEATIRHIQWIANDTAAVKAFVNVRRGQKLPAVIEFIRDAGYYRVYFTEEQVNASVVLAGVQAEGFRRVEGLDSPRADPFAVEAKYFCEVRLLNRDIHVIIEGADDFGNILGTIVHPNGNISVLLLENGLARVNDRTAALTQDPGALRTAQRMAQDAHVRRWKDFVGRPPAESREYTARVMEVVSGDCVILLEQKPEGCQEPPEERRVFLASIRSPRVGTRTRPDEPWAPEAKEFVRKRLIGKRVKVVLEYMREPTPSPSGNPLPPASDNSGRMHFVSIVYDNGKLNIGEQLVAAGLARTLPHRSDDPSAENFATLIEKESEALAEKKGIHGPLGSAPKNRVNDLLGPQNVQKARSFEESLKRADILEGVVEHVFNGSRFKIRIPSESLAISFALAGIRTPALSGQQQSLHQQQPLRPAEEFAEDALQFSREHLMQRQVTFKVDVCDRGGNFIGTMWTGAKQCVNVMLVANGLAEVFDRGGALRDRAELEKAQSEAEEQRLGMWMVRETRRDRENERAAAAADTVADQPAPLTRTLECVVVSHCERIDDFFLHELLSSAIDQLQTEIATFIENNGGDSGTARNLSLQYTPATLPKIGECLLARFTEDHSWYRAQVESISRQKFTLQVRYIDFGNSESVTLDDIRRCPPELSLTKTPPLALRCCLAGLKPPPDMEVEAAQAFDELTNGRRFRCLLEFFHVTTRRNAVQLFPLSVEAAHLVAANGGVAVDSCSINEILLSRGLAVFDKKAKTAAADVLKAAELKARKEHLNIWQHGDIDTEPESDGARLGKRSLRSKNNAVGK